MRKTTELEHGLYYVERDGQEYHKISGSWSFETSQEEIRVMSALLRGAQTLLIGIAEKNSSGDTEGFGEILEPDLESMPFGLYYVSTDGALYDFFAGAEALPPLWGAELVVAQTLVEYARKEIVPGVVRTSPVQGNAAMPFVPWSSRYNITI